jgi:CO/xanthine dehydrogenase FAD-binding subunit
VTERTFFAPTTLEEALTTLAAHPKAGIVAGGTDLVVGDRSGKKALPEEILSITELMGINRIVVTDGAVKAGALVTHAAIERSPEVRTAYTALADASALVGSPATRSAGTIGGNIANASPAIETGSPLLVFDASVELQSKAGRREVRYADFVSGPGQTTRRPGELLTAVLLPAPPHGRVGSAYVRLEYRQAMEIAIVGAAAMLVLDDRGTCAEARIALTAVAPTCVRAPRAEESLRGKAITEVTLQTAAEHVASAAKPIDDVRGSAQYRRAMTIVIARRALETAWRRAKGEQP